MNGKSMFAVFAPLVVGTLIAAPMLVAPSVATAQAARAADKLSEGFANPPSDARPWTWFHVMSGNMTREGLTKDLESLAAAGVGGIVLFHVTQGISIGPVKFNSPEHLDLIAHAAAECERLGIKFTFHNADGWSSTGGPWITPEQSMKKLVWTEAMVNGGKLAVALAHPTTQEGYYRDVAVLAYPALAAEVADAKLKPRISVSDPGFDLAKARDGDPLTLAKLDVPEKGQGWVQYEYAEPIALRHVKIDNIPERNVQIGLSVSEDGKTFVPVRELDKPRLGKSEWSVNAAFDPVRARYFRVTADIPFEMGEIALSTAAGIDNPDGHTILAYVFGAKLPERIRVPADAIIDPAKVINLTPNLKENGRLEAQLPPGTWKIMRFGQTSTGARNVNGSAEGTGLEVDKFDAAAFKTHYDNFIGPVIARTRAVAPTALAGVMIDSYEVGGQNWTGDYLKKFAARHAGLDLTPWLPVFTGKVVGDGQQTRDMLARIRAFNEELVRQNYYTAFATAMQREGLDSIVQPYGNGPLNEVAVGATASVPAGEFWMGREGLNVGHAVSAGRMYDKPLIAAEAFTGEPQVNWRFSPALGKKWGDRAWAAGVNQFLFHRFAHQANTHVSPGMTMNRWGSHFDRTQPWWDNGGAAWFKYMARGQFLLRQGYAVSDVALFMGEDSPVECPEKAAMSDKLPKGVDYDCIDAATLMNRSRFVDGALVLPNGARYSLLWWPHRRAPGAAALARLKEARAAGVPVALTHLGGDPAKIYSAAGLKPRITSDGPLPQFTHRRIGDEDIFFLLNFEEQPFAGELSFAVAGRRVELWNPVTGKMQMAPDATQAGGRTSLRISLAPGESMFVAMRSPVSPAATAGSRLVSVAPAQTLSGPWQVRFDPADPKSKTKTWPTLIDWRNSGEEEVQHYSGKAAYSGSFTVSAAMAKRSDAIMLDLGQVEVAARVLINGKDVGTAWTAPYRIDITDAVKPGSNSVEITIANLWVNRLVGDAALPDTSGYKPEGRVPEKKMVDWYAKNQPPPPGPRRTFTTQQFYRANDPLLSSGLIGPVKLEFMKQGMPNAN